MLCAICISMFAANPRYSRTILRGRHHACIEDVEKAAQQGCYLCSEIILDYEPERADTAVILSSDTFVNTSVTFELTPLDRLGTLYFESADGRLASTTYDVVYTKDIEVPASYDKYLDEARADMADEPWRVRDDCFISAFTEVPESTGDVKVLEIAECWLKQCLATHTNCELSHRSPGGSWVPKRLLDLSSDCGRPRLIITALEPPSGRYATLSHCWGKEPICILTADNLDEWSHQGISSNVLSNTFRDTLAVTRMLNIRYLWVDSLCILQSGAGSTEDWREHAVAMRQVYTNSLVNIAAAQADVTDNKPIRMTSSQSKGNAVWAAWQNMIDAYTLCDLTYPDKDILVAIAGIAERFGQVYDHQYAAGHFRQHLPFDLVWQNKGERAKTYRAPSWSWASRDGGVRFALGDCPFCNQCCNSFATVEDLRVDLIDATAVYGQVQHVELDLVGHLIPAVIEPTRSTGTGLRQRTALYTHRPVHDDFAPGPATYKNKSIVWAEADLDDEDDSLRGFAIASRFTAWALPIVELKPPNSPTASREARYHGLIIRKVAKDKYVRVGIYQVQDAVMMRILREEYRVTQKICLI
ncbi:heterokaryon incompatibility protein-domain-containing protein [Paraphoma chrysanthemicola]|nr:heterokaryon incompatibility protein-domain-containing protein [Paraphoma chrysanthemicola]